MRLDRRAFLLAATAAAACAGRGGNSPLARAARYLWAQQSDEGGFHSLTYGLLRSGQSLTPFVLDALLRVPETVAPRPDGAVDRALGFISRHTSPDGALGRMDATADDYPNYATALAVSAIVAARPSGWHTTIAPMVGQLRVQQFSEERGWGPEQAAYGGWGMGGPVRTPPEAGHVDLSMTRVVLEALRASGVPGTDPVMARARVFLERAQNADGGFHFSPVDPALNKAGEDESGFISYGTASADGLLALRAAGVPETDDRVAGAIRWLGRHHLADRVPGFDGTEASWAVGLRFYYAAAVSRAVPGLAVVLPEPLPDGAFRNANGLVKEDDPLIATPLAIHALASRL